MQLRWTALGRGGNLQLDLALGSEWHLLEVIKEILFRLDGKITTMHA